MTHRSVAYSVCSPRRSPRRRGWPLRLGLSAVLAALASAPSAALADVFEPTELDFAAGATSNPYTDIDMYADFSGPNGEIVRVHAFWDGGSTFRIRFTPTAAGSWTYETIATGDASLDGLTGTVSASETSSEGFVVLDPKSPHYFRRSRGAPRFLMGDTNWRSLSTVGGSFESSEFETFVDTRASQGFNFYRTYIVPIDPEGQPSNANEGGAAFEPWDPDHLNPAYFAAVDARIQYALEHGLTPALLFGSDGQNLTDFFGWDNGKLERYVRYCIARYAAYDVLWELRAEYEDQGSGPPDAEELALQLGEWTQDFDPWHHPRSIHTTGSNRAFGEDGWLDYLMHQGQPGNPNGYAWDWIARDREFGKPVLNEEFYYEDSGAGATHDHHVDAATVRKGAWHVMTAGASGLAYGNTGTYNSRSQPFQGVQWLTSDGATFMSNLASFWRQTRFSRLSPPSSTSASDLVRAPGEEYVAYLETGGTRSIYIAPGEYSVSWYNPRTGATESTSTITSAGESVDFDAPDNEDWVLHVVRDIPEPTEATALGKVISLGPGADPDVAVASDGTFHVVYLRGSTVYYRTVDVDGSVGDEEEVGPGEDPRIAVGPDNVPHVVMVPTESGGPTVSYAKWQSSGFDGPIALVSSGNNRKPRIEVDSGGNAFISYEDRSSTGDRVRYVRVAPDMSLSDVTVVGADNNGGLAVDANDTIHFTFREASVVRHVSSPGPGNVSSEEEVIPGTSDFSELEVSEYDGSMHVVAEVAGGLGIYHATRTGTDWDAPELFAEEQVTGVGDPDNVGPAVASDAVGRVYITFAGLDQVPYYATVDEAGNRSVPTLLDPGGGTTGGKYRNPNVEEVPGGGTVAAWQCADHVYLRTLGMEDEEPGTGGSSGSSGSAGATGSGGSSGSGGSGGDAGTSGSGGSAGTAGAAGTTGGPPASSDDGGCGCRLATSNRDVYWWALLGLAALGRIRRRAS